MPAGWVVAKVPPTSPFDKPSPFPPVHPCRAATASFVATDGGLEWETTLKKPLMKERAVWRSRLAVFESLVYSKI